LPGGSLGIRSQLEVLEVRCVPASLTAGTAVDISKVRGSQSEASVAVDPINPNIVVASSNDTGLTSGIRFYRSTDGGATWTNRVIGAGDGLGQSACCDGQLTFDKFGNLFLVFFDFQSTGVGANLVTSSDGGATLRLLGSVITDISLDQPSVAVGPGPTPGSGSVWVSTKTSGGLAVTGAPVTGLGAIGAFSAPVTLASSVGGNFGNVAVGPNGQVLVTYQLPVGGSGPSTVYTNLDPDGLGPQPFGARRIATPTNVGGFRPVPFQPNRTIDAEANVAYDTSGGPHNGRAYLVYTDAPSVASSDTNVFVRVSDDNGATWSQPIRVNDDTGTNSQGFSGLAVDPVTGNLAVGWLDARNSTANNSVEYFVSASTDGGLTFLPNVQVTPGLSNANLVTDPNEFGDFYTFSFFNNVIWTIWPSNSASLPGNPDLPNLDIGVAPVTVTTGPPPPPPLPPVTFTGFVAVGSDAGGRPRVRLIDVSNGLTALDFNAFDPHFIGGVRVARADLNGDGFPDIIAAAGPGGGPHVRVFDGLTGRQLPGPIGSFFAYAPGFLGGVYVAAADVNGDGVPDVITGAGAGGGPHVRVFSGVDGHEIMGFFAYDVHFHGGVTVAAGDVNGDGIIDIITGAGPGGGPHVRVFSGLTGAVLSEFFPFAPLFHGGVFVAAGDVDGDGKADIITGAGISGGPQVRIFSGATGQTLQNFLAFPSSPGTGYTGDTLYNYGVRVAAEDINGDGKADIFALPGPGGRPNARVYAVNTTLLTSFAAFDPTFLGGVFVG
jgi:hypothetical protein